MENGKRPAYPAETDQKYYLGLTKREYFAAIAMQGMLAHGRTQDGIPEKSVQIADALLAELDKTKSE